MAYDAEMADRVRELIAERTTNVIEKRMFGGLCFLVDEKICVAVKSDRMLARLAADVYEQAVELDGITVMAKKSGPVMKGYIYIDYQQLRTPRQLAHWVNLALDFNPLAKSSKKK